MRRFPGSRRPPAWPGWTVLSLWTWVLFYLASAPSGVFPRMPAWGIPWDKIVHGTEWAIWSGVLAATLARQVRRIDPRRLFLWTVSAAGAAALLHELYQIPVPGRICDAYDWLADMIGAIFAAAAYARFAPAFRRRVGLWFQGADTTGSRSGLGRLRRSS